MVRPAKESRQNFESGKTDAWTAGEHGSSVRLYVEKGKLKIRFQAPSGKSKRLTLFGEDTPSLRRRAAVLALKKAESLRGPESAPEAHIQAEDITVREVMVLYLRRFPGFDARFLTATASKLREWHRSLPEETRELSTVPKEATLVSDVYGFRRLLATHHFRGDRRVMDLEPGDATAHFSEWVSGGGSKRTGANDLDRISGAINYVIRQHRRTVGLTLNPLDGRHVDRTKADIPEYSRAELLLLWDAAPQLASEGQWHCLVAAGIGSSGRRVGSILGLTLADHDFESGDVTWRAEEAKGEHYGRGDEVRPMTAQHRTAVEWVREHHPNPLGPDAPLLWRTGGDTLPQNPEEAVPYSTLWGQLIRLEELAGVEHKEGRAWHSFRRAVATYLADAIGDGKASEFIGMTTETLRKYRYKKVQPEAMREARDAMDGGFSASKGPQIVGDIVSPEGGMAE